MVDRFRQRFVDPYLATREKLQAIGDALAPGSAVSGRPKRFDRIIEKLVRQPTHRLSRMQDVGGCRLVLPVAPPESDAKGLLGEVAAGVRKSWLEIRAEDDYVAVPKQSGYRAHHLVVVEDGELIEIQLRTYRQDLWAQLVESINRSSAIRIDLGDGPEHQKLLLARMSKIYADLDAGEPYASAVEREGLHALLPLLAEILKRD